MQSKHNDLFEESKELFGGEGYEDEDYLAPRARNGDFLTPRHSSNGGSSASKKGGKWFDLPRLDDLFNSKDKKSRPTRSESEGKEEQVK